MKEELIPYDQSQVAVLYDVGSCNVHPDQKSGFDDENYVIAVTNNFCCAKQNNYLQAYQCNR